MSMFQWQTRRQGTQNQGISYEIKICALLGIRFLNPKYDVNTFEISQNLDGYGNFDDVILTVKKNCGQSFKFCMQLKHFQLDGYERKKKLKYNHFCDRKIKSKAPFNLKNYRDTLQGKIQVENTYVIFTNKKKDQNEDKFVTCNTAGIQLINFGGEAFFFDRTLPGNSGESFEVDEEERFLKLLVILCNQPHEEDLNNLIKATLKDVLGLNSVKTEEVFAKYLEHVTNWSNGYCGSGRCLTKSEIQFKLSEFILNPFVYTSEQQLNYSSEKSIEKWTNIYGNYKTIVVENLRTQKAFEESTTFTFKCIENTLLSFTQVCNWSRTFSQQDLEYFCEKCTELNVENDLQKFWGNEKVNQVTLSKIYLYLWKQNIMPLVLRVDKDDDFKIIHNISNITSRRLIIFYNGEMSEEFIERTGTTTLRNFSQLLHEDQKLVLDQPIKFQGKKVNANVVLDSEQIASKLCISDIIDILNGNFCISKKKFDLPTYFIERTLSPIIIKPNMFKHHQIINVIICNAKEKFLQHAKRKNIEIDDSQIFVLNKIYDFSDLKCPDGYKVIICLNYTFEEIFSEGTLMITIPQFGLHTSCLVYDFEEASKCSTLVEPSKTDSVHVILTKKELFLQYAKIHDIEVESFEIFDTTQIADVDYLPVTCMYILASNEHEFRKTRKLANAHFYKLHCNAEQNLILEWLGSHGSCSSVKQFIDYSNYEQIPKNFDFDYFYVFNKLNLIVGPPGMGKSVLMNYLIEICPSTLWYLLINCNEQSNYFLENAQNMADVDKHIKYFLSYADLTSIEQVCAEYYLKTRQFCLYFDGFDEVQPGIETTVCQFLQGVVENGFSVFVTTRTVKKETLEETFQYPARTIDAFNEKNQFQYLMTYFNTKIPEQEVKVKEFVDKLLTRRGISAWDVEFSGIPLQTLMISEIYQEECLRYCQNVECPLQVEMDVLQIYEKFINLKIENLQRKERINNPNLEKYFKIAVKHSLENHKLCAIQAIFNQSVDSDLSQFVQDIKDGEEKIGLIDKFLDGDVPVFVHRTFAEYLAALYVSEKFQKDTVKSLHNIILKNATYDIIRQILDRLLCKNNPLHLALLNLDTVRFIDILSDETQNRKLDEGGRNILHLAMSWGRRHTILSDDELNDICDTAEWNIFKTKLESAKNNCRKGTESEMLIQAIFSCAWSEELFYAKDLILGATPLEYGLKVLALENIDLFLKQNGDMHTALKSFLESFDYKQILFICALFDYKALALSVLNTLTIKEASLRLNYYGKFHITLMHFAAWYGSNGIIDLLIDKDQDLVNVVEGRRWQNPLHWAAGKGSKSTVELILRRGGNVKAIDNLMRSPLYIATETRNKDVMDVLEEAERKIGGKKTKITKLFVAVTAGNLEEVRNLLDSGESPNETTDGGNWPITRAAYSGNAEIVQLLLDRGADVNVTDEHHWSALMQASWRGHAEIVRILLDAGANLNVTNLGVHWNALKLAYRWNHMEIIDMLKDYLKRKLL